MIDNGLMPRFVPSRALPLASAGACVSYGTGAWVARETRDSTRLEGPLTQGRQSIVTFGTTVLTSSL